MDLMASYTSPDNFMPPEDDRYWSPWQENKPATPNAQDQEPLQREWPHDIVENAMKRRLIEREFIKFCENTSLRGIPRIVKAKNSITKSMWLVSVIVLFVACFTAMILLTNQFTEYDVIHPPRVRRDKKSPFPSVSVCNLRPLSITGKRYLEKRNFLNPRQFANVVNRFSAMMYVNRGKDNLTNYYTVTSTFSLGGYLESLPLNVSEVSRNLGHKLNDLVVNCQLTYQQGSQGNAEPCAAAAMGRWDLFVHATYLNCYTYNLDIAIANKARALEMYLYLNEDLDSASCVDCFTGDVKSQLSGALIVIHKAGTYPDINHKSINLMPGSLTEMKLKTLQNKQKEAPYGRCSKDTPVELLLHNKTYVYSEYGCREAQTQREINDKCFCNAIEYPIRRGFLPYCSQLPSFVNGKCAMALTGGEKYKKTFDECVNEIREAVKRIKCKFNVTGKYNRDTIENCTLPCSFYSYESDQSTSIWPTKSWQLTWLRGTKNRKVLLNKPEMEPYRIALRRLDENNVTGAKKILAQNNILERNLLAVLINRPDYNLHVVAEKEVFSLTSFLSQTGGLISMFIGLTMLGVVEIFELLIHCIGILRGQNPDTMGRSKSSDIMKKNSQSRKTSRQKEKENRHICKHEVVL